MQTEMIGNHIITINENNLLKYKISIFNTPIEKVLINVFNLI